MGNGSSKSEPALDQSYISRSTNGNTCSSKKKKKSIKLQSIKTAKKPEIMGIMSEMNPELVLGMIQDMKRDTAGRKEERRGGTPKAA